MDNFRLPKPLDEKAKQSAPKPSDYAEVIIAELALNLQNLAPLDGRELPEIKILCYADKIIVQCGSKSS
jgi:hypothetical protein